MAIMASFFFHSYECQGIQTKNPLGKILNLSFDLEPLKWTPIASLGINFAKDYQKDSYNKTKIDGNKIKKIKTD
jgi:hypothetical protein